MIVKKGNEYAVLATAKKKEKKNLTDMPRGWRQSCLIKMERKKFKKQKEGRKKEM